MADQSTQQTETRGKLRPHSLSGRLPRGHLLLLGLVLALGFFARTWEYGQLPPSLNPDEASTGVEARNLLRYGQDRNGVAYPVKFISWGSGQDVLYAYLLVPLVAALGLSPVVVRIPMLAAGLATLPLVYLVSRRVFGSGVALTAAFMLAISPWHVLLSRWALDSNLFPFVFLAGFACLLMVRHNGWWFLPSCALLALSLYTYGTAYVVVPVFAVGAVLLTAPLGFVRRIHWWSGTAAFLCLACPIALLIIVNGLGWDSIRLGPLTVPSFPVPVRWESTTLLSSSDVIAAAAANVVAAARLLATESDGISYNVIEPFGVFFGLGMALTTAGLVVVGLRRDRSWESRLLLLWLAAGVCVGLLSAVNINRFNIVFMPMIILGARAIFELQRIQRVVGAILLAGLLALFATFTVAYHGSGYRGVVDFKFQNGLIPALMSARAGASGTICVTGEINMPYIYALFTDATSPAEFQATVKYVDPSEPLRQVASFGDFVFGKERCAAMSDTTYVLRGQEIPPHLGNRYEYEFFDNFVVFSPSR